MKNLLVSRMSYIDSLDMDADDLFAGYDELWAITYSHSLSRIASVMKHFAHGEIVIGTSELYGTASARLFAMQEYAVNYTGKDAYLKERIENGELVFHVVNDIVSHQKIYLLKGEGKWRVIFGSANFSEAAFSGVQKENIAICDDQACFDEYMRIFRHLRDNHCGRIAVDAAPIDEDGENLGELPIVREIRKKGAIVIEQPQSDEEIDYGYYMVDKISKRASMLAHGKLRAKADGLVKITVDKIEEILKGAKKKSEQAKERRREFPRFVIDYDNSEVSLNGEKWDLNPEREDVAHDIRLLMEHMDGFNAESFVGDVRRLSEIYWKVLNFMFLSPFIAKIRHEIGNDDWLRFAPMYLLLSGSSDAGKTAFVKLVLKMMFNGSPNRALLSNRHFSTDQMAAMKADACGYPVAIDEVTPMQWAHAGGIVKNDTMLLEMGNTRHPCFIIIANDLNGVKPEISKRVAVFNPDCRMPGDLAAKNGRKVKRILREMGNSLYREYCRKILDALPVLLEKSATDTQPPDIWAMSSQILADIFAKCGEKEKIPVHTWEDYVGQKNICDNALRILLDEHALNPASFEANHGYNQLFVDFSQRSQSERFKIISSLVKEMPVTCKCRQIGEKVCMDLRETESFSGLSFPKKGFFKRLFS